MCVSVCTHHVGVYKNVAFHSAVQNDLEYQYQSAKHDNYDHKPKENISKNKQITTVISGEFNKNMCAHIEKQSHACTHAAMRRTLNRLASVRNKYTHFNLYH